MSFTIKYRECALLLAGSIITCKFGAGSWYYRSLSLATKPCGDGHMTCVLTGRCLPLRYKCDLEFDCGVNELGVLDTSDEDPNIC